MYEVEEFVIGEFEKRFKEILLSADEEEIKYFFKFLGSFLPIMDDGIKTKDGQIDTESFLFETAGYLRSKIGKTMFIGQSQEDRDANDVIHLTSVLQSYLDMVAYYKFGKKEI